MLGEHKQEFFTVKDLSAQEFIEAFSQYLKKNNLIERPAWADYVKTGTRTLYLIQAMNLHPLMMIGSMSKWHLLPVRSSFVPDQVLDYSPIFTED